MIIFGIRFRTGLWFALAFAIAMSFASCMSQHG